MRLKSVTLRNFRGYGNTPVVIQVDTNITGIVGKNDAGKSSILEALDIFFGGEEVTLDKDDFYVGNPDAEMEIRCTFENPPQQIILDATNTTSLAAEYLLNADGLLEIAKRYKKGAPSKPTTILIANHPSSEGFENLHSLTIAQLKAKGKEIGVLPESLQDARKCAEWRTAIWEKVPKKAVQELKVDDFKEEAKSIKDKIFDCLPIFALFRADRESKDSDPHAKNPLQAAVKQAQAELKAEIEDLQKRIMTQVVDRASKTLEKLREMDESLANQLTPRLKSLPKWTFDFNLDGEDDIPINKRGSGVRRLVLLNFFRAEAERRVTQKNAPSIIYAFEEPENSQHPSNQKMLVQALIEIAQKESCQVLLTTHVPALAGLLPIEGLRLVEKSDRKPKVSFGTTDVLDRICETLGLLPERGVTGAKALVLVEGVSDVGFLHHACSALKTAGYIPATFEEKGICPVSIGGCGNLNHWLTKKIADQFKIPWGVLLDSDAGTAEANKNIQEIQRLKADGKKAYLTRKREPENYISPDVLTPYLDGNPPPAYTDTCDAKTIIGRATKTRTTGVLEKFWPLMTAQQIRQAETYKENGVSRFEFTEMIVDFSSLIG